MGTYTLRESYQMTQELCASARASAGLCFSFRTGALESDTQNTLFLELVQSICTLRSLMII